MIDLNIHNVTDITVGKAVKIDRSNGDGVFYTRRVYVTNDDGKVATFVLFSDKKRNLTIR